MREVGQRQGEREGEKEREGEEGGREGKDKKSHKHTQRERERERERDVPDSSIYCLLPTKKQHVNTECSERMMSVVMSM